MKNQLSIPLLFFLVFLLGGCFSPINLVNDNASILDPGGVQVSGMYSSYNLGIVHDDDNGHLILTLLKEIYLITSVRHQALALVWVLVMILKNGRFVLK